MTTVADDTGGAETADGTDDAEIADDSVNRAEDRSVSDHRETTETVSSVVRARLASNSRRWLGELRSFQGLMLLACLLMRATSPSVLPQTGLDQSWMVALNVARRDHLKFGRDLEYTYGPWGFLDWPLGLSRFNMVAGFVFAVFCLTVGWIALRGVLQRFMRRDLAAIAATAIVTFAIPAGGTSAILVLGVTILVMDYLGPAQRRAYPWVPAFAASCAAFLLQVKFSEGLLLTVIAILACIFAPDQRLRRAVESLLAYVVVTVLAWLIGGQSLSDWPNWFKTSVEITRGFTEAMASDLRPHLLDYVLSVGLIVIVVSYVIRLLATRAWRPAIGVGAVTVVIVYIAFRESTDRHDVGHEVFLYLWAIPALAWFVAYGKSQLFRRAVLVVAVLLAYSGMSISPPNIHARLSESFEIAGSGEYQSIEMYRAKTAAQTQYNVPRDILTAMDGHPVQVDGSEATLPWAYNLDWRPAPLFQSFVAFTEQLDQDNATWLEKSPESQLILRPPQTAIDGRNSLWDPPNYVLAEMCNLTTVDSNDSWLLLQKGSNRCGSSVPVSGSTLHVEPGQSIRVPMAGGSDLVTMSFTEDTTGLFTRVFDLINKPIKPLTVTADGTIYRLPRALSSGPLIVSVPPTVGWPDQFGGDVTYRQVSFNRPGTVAFSSTSVTAQH